MKFLKKILLVVLFWIFWLLSVWNFVSADDKKTDSCIQLNTDIPWVTDNSRCLKEADADNVFWKLMGAMMKLLINMTVAVAFIALIASGVMMTVSWASQSTAWKWKELLKKVVLWIVLLGLSGLILHTINPNFFKLVEPVISLISNV